MLRKNVGCTTGKSWRAVAEDWAEFWPLVLKQGGSPTLQLFLAFLPWVSTPGALRTPGVHSEGIQQAAQWTWTPAAFTRSLQV